MATHRNILTLLVFSILFLLMVAHGKAQEGAILLKRKCPIFERPDVKSKILGYVPGDVKVPAGRKVDSVIKRQMYPHGWFPLMFYTSFYQVKIPGKRPVWISPDLVLDEKGRLFPRASLNRKYLNLMIVWKALLLILLVVALRKKLVATCFREFDTHPVRNTLFLMSFLVLIRLILLSFYLYLGGQIMVYPTDEMDYFTIGRDLLNGQFANSWKYTLGQGLIYVPFILVTGSESYYDMVDCVTVFNGMVLAPSILVMVFLIVRKISNSPVIAFVTTFLLTVLPFFYYPYETSFKAIVHFPQSSIYDYYVFYYTMIAAGWNGMSDMPAMFFLFTIILLCLYFPKRLWILFLCSALFGIACLIRINNVFYAPLLAYLFWLAMSERFSADHKLLWKSIPICLALFLLFFLPQLIVNKMQFGSFMTFPYILHPHRAAEGFTFHDFAKNAPALINCNCLYMYLGTAAMLLMKYRYRIIFALWTIPVILFFCGYPVVTAGLIRFILPVYAPLIAAVVVFFSDFRFDYPRRRAWFYLVLVLMFFALVLVSPFRPNFQFNLDSLENGLLLVQILTLSLPVICLVSVIWLLRKKEMDLMKMKMIIMLLVFYSGWYVLVIILMLFVLGRSFMEAGNEVYAEMSKSGRISTD